MNQIVISQQLRIIIFAVVFGCIFAILYDIIKVVRMLFDINGNKGIRLKIKNIVFVHLADVLYMIFLAASYCIFLFYYNSGQNRWYLLFAFIVGFFVYRVTVGKIVMLILGKLAVCIRKIIRVIIVVPIFKLISLLYKLLLPIKKYFICRNAVRITNKEKIRFVKLLEVDQSTEKG